jgi:hypothetical protein
MIHYDIALMIHYDIALNNFNLQKIIINIICKVFHYDIALNNFTMILLSIISL